MQADTGEPAAVLSGLRAWLCSDRARSPAGAVYAWRDDAGAASFEYPEVTGYALTHAAGLPDPSDRELAAGHRAAGWLAARLGSGDLSARDSWDGEAIYTFDLAMIATGLMAFGTRCADPDWTSRGVRMARAIRDEIAGTGSLRPLPSLPGNVSVRSTWSTEGCAHLLKAVQCLLWAGHLGDDGFVEAAGTLVAAMAGLQRDDGRFVTHPADRETMLHPHLYAVEGLWMFAAATGDQAAEHRARAATEWVWRHQRPGGGFPRWVAPSTGGEGPEQADLTAQALRAGILLGVAEQRHAATAAWLAGSAVHNADGTVAVPYQPGSGTLHQNSWTTLFAAQALTAYLEGRQHVGWRSLV